MLLYSYMGVVAPVLNTNGLGELAPHLEPPIDGAFQPGSVGLSESTGSRSPLRYLAAVGAGVVALGIFPGVADGASSAPPKTADNTELVVPRQTAQEQQVISWIVCNGAKPRLAFKDIEVVRFYCKTSASAQTYLEQCKDKEVEMCRKVIRRSNYIVKRCRDGNYTVCEKFESGVKKARRTAIKVLEEVV